MLNLLMHTIRLPHDDLSLTWRPLCGKLLLRRSIPQVSLDAQLVHVGIKVVPRVHLVDLVALDM